MITLLIRRNADGEIRRRVLEDADWHDGTFFWLTEGNYACDCNRRLEFERAGGNDDLDCLDSACGEGAYSILWAYDGDRKIAIDTALVT